MFIPFYTNSAFHYQQCIQKVTSHESQSGSRKFNLREPLFCYGSHIESVTKYGELCRIYKNIYKNYT